MQILRATADELRLWRTNDEDVRQKLKEAWLERTGGLSFRLMSSNGRFMGTVRAENSTAEPQFDGVSPEACACKDLTGTPAGMHHPICKNRELWEAYRGGALPVPGMQSGLGVQLMKIAKPQPQASGVVHHQIAKKIDIHTPHISTAHEGKARAPAVMQPVKQYTKPVLPVAPTLPSPETCKCTQFTKGLNHDQKQHHPICEFFEKWKAAHPTPAIAEAQLVADLTERNNIPASFRAVGMYVRCADSGEIYKLEGGITNLHWIEKLPKAPLPEGPLKTETQEVLTQILKENEARGGSTTTVNENPMLVTAQALHPSVWNDSMTDVAKNARREVDLSIEATHDKAVGDDCVLVDLNTRVIMREATLEEIAEAALEEEKSGAPTVVVDETMYAVLKRSEVESTTSSRDAIAAYSSRATGAG